MGGFHLVEPVGGNSTSPTGPQQAASASTPRVSVPSTDAEGGRARSGNAPELEEGRVTILTLEMLRELVKDAEFSIRITDLEIADRSKGDALSKVIFILQSSWFILQCIGRLVQGLSLTQLELTTLALASLNGITFILWWDKPLGVRAPVRVYMSRKLTDAERDTERVVFCSPFVFILTRDCRSNLLSPLSQLVQSPYLSLSSPSSSSSSSSSSLSFLAAPPAPYNTSLTSTPSCLSCHTSRSHMWLLGLRFSGWP